MDPRLLSIDPEYVYLRTVCAQKKNKKTKESKEKRKMNEKVQIYQPFTNEYLILSALSLSLFLSIPLLTKLQL